MSASQLHDDPTRTTPIGLARYASDFLKAALAADEVLGGKSAPSAIAPVPVMYLVGHAIELILKAFLAHAGVSLKDLRVRHGHDLQKSMTDATNRGLGKLVALERAEVEAIMVLDNLYSSKQLEYIVTGSRQYPVFGLIEAAALRLVHGIAPHVGYPVRDLPHAL